MTRSVLTLALLLALWEGLTRLHLLPGFVLPSPQAVITAYRPSMLEAAMSTLARAVIGFITGITAAYASILIAHLMGSVRAADDNFSAARAVPALAAMPLFLLWFGLGETARILVISLTVLAFVAGPLAEATRKLPREWSIQRERLGRSRLWEYMNVVAPGTLGQMIGAWRVGLAIALTTAVATDFMGASSGLGRSVDTARVTFNVPAIFLLLIIAAMMGLALDRLVAGSLRRAAHWLGRTSKG